MHREPTMTRTSCWIATGLLALSACTTAGRPAAGDQTASAPPRSCFSANNVNNYSPVDARTVNISVGVKDVYRLDLASRCPDVDWTTRIVLAPRNGSTVCSGREATLTIQGPFGHQRCNVRAVTKLSPEEIAALRVR